VREKGRREKAQHKYKEEGTTTERGRRGKTQERGRERERALHV
jgi:hypothetical protein